MNMRLLLNIICLLTAQFLNVVAQTSSDRQIKDSRPARLGKFQMVDKSFMECVYEHCTYDPFFDQTKIEDEILEIGRNSSIYGNYNKYRFDSIIAKDYPNGLSVSEYDKIGEKLKPKPRTVTIKYFNDNKIKHYESIFIDHYVYDEVFPSMDWEILDETDEICGYTCKKATIDFRGRTWNAWYCEEIPVNNGPLKFGGLPGLILKVEDSQKEHIFEAMQVRKSNKDFGYTVRSFLIPTDRKTFNKMLLDFMEDPGEIITSSPLAPKNLDGTPLKRTKRRFFYNPVEKD